MHNRTCLIALGLTALGLTTPAYGQDSIAQLTRQLEQRNAQRLDALEGRVALLEARGNHSALPAPAAALTGQPAASADPTPLPTLAPVRYFLEPGGRITGTDGSVHQLGVGLFSHYAVEGTSASCGTGATFGAFGNAPGAGSCGSGSCGSAGTSRVGLFGRRR